MKFKVSYSSGGIGPVIEINTLKELKAFAEKECSPIIVTFGTIWQKPEQDTIEVYDDYRE